MLELSDITVNVRARLADALALVIEADSRVRRWCRVEFAEDGGAVVVVELHRDLSGIAQEVIARELEFAAASAVPKLAWVRVQVR
jgi:hypothetical protein